MSTNSDRPIAPRQPNLSGSRLDTALWAIDAGLWPVAIHPYDAKIASPGKAPIGAGWGLQRPTKESIRSTFTRYPRANLGLKLGAEGRVVDLDVDDPEAAEPILARLFPDGIPDTWGWTNAEGKFHLLFAYDARLADLGKSIIKGGEHYAGIEIRIGAAPGEKKQLQTVIPPSLMANGAARIWLKPIELRPFPESILEDLKRYASAKEPSRPSDHRPSVPREERNGRWTPEARAFKYLESCDPAVSGAGGHNQTLKTCVKIGPGFALTPETAYRLLLDHYNPRCDPPWSEAELRHKVEEAYKVETRRGWLLDEPSSNGYHTHNGKPPAEPPRPPAELVPREEPTPRERPAIVVTTEEHLIIDQAVKAISLDPTVYQRGNMLVMVLRDASSKKQAIDRPKGTPRIATMPFPRLRELLAKNARWVKQKKDRNGEVSEWPAHPPEWAVSGTACRGEWPEIRPIAAVIESPALRHDGTVLDIPGWDEGTSLLYEPNASFPAIPKRPGKDQAVKAAEDLLFLVQDFPFATPSDRAAWLAALLTPLARFAIEGPCPLFPIDANSPGTGKSKLTDIIAVISTGRDMPRTAYPDSDEEMRKRITSVALAGDRLMLLDNIASTFGGSSLDSALTGTAWRDRALGKLEMTAELPLFTVWYATGNNLTFRGDVLRRIVPCRLETSEERPEERNSFTIPGDLLKHVRTERSRLVAAALTLLRAHAVAGRPSGGVNPMASFNSWSEVVRSAVLWSTGIDPCDSRELLRASDPDTILRQAIVCGWAELENAHLGRTVGEVLKLLKQKPDDYSMLREAFMEWSRKPDEMPGPRAIGMRLKSMRGRVVDGKCLQCVSYKGTQEWKIVEVEPK